MKKIKYAFYKCAKCDKRKSFAEFRMRASGQRARRCIICEGRADLRKGIVDKYCYLTADEERNQEFLLRKF